MRSIPFFRLLLIGFVAMLCLALTVPARAGRKEVVRYSFKDQNQTAYAEVYGFDECISSYMEVHAVDGRVKTEGRPTMISIISGYVSQENHCEGASLYGFFFTELDDDAFQTQNQLRSATLNTTVQACGNADEDDEEECFPVEIQLTWKGRGDTLRRKGREQSKSPDYRSMYRFDGQTRYATLSGTITTPFDSSAVEYGFAELQSVKYGSMAIYSWE